MKSSLRRTGLILLLAASTALSACAQTGANLPETTAVPGTDPLVPAAVAPASLHTGQTATLYFRYLDEPYLAAESRTVTRSPDQPFEMALLAALLSGPGTRSADLTALFPDGTRVLSTATEGRTLFVTLSREILNAYPDEPDDWSQDASWRIEAPLRRVLCMQSLAATVTENCDVDRVQILVEQTAGQAGLRLTEDYYGRGGAGVAQALERDEELLLTPGGTLKVILEYWKTQNWADLYKYVARQDPASGEDRKTYADFVTAMGNLPQLTAYGFSGGSVSLAGDQATYTVQAALRAQDGQTEESGGHILRLCREDGLWRITLSQLTDWLEEGA